jgi:hypothetical protein
MSLYVFRCLSILSTLCLLSQKYHEQVFDLVQLLLPQMHISLSLQGLCVVLLEAGTQHCSEAKAFYRQDKLGAVLLVEQMAIQHGVKIRFLTPSSDWIKQQVTAAISRTI